VCEPYSAPSAAHVCPAGLLGAMGNSPSMCGAPQNASAFENVQHAPGSPASRGGTSRGFADLRREGEAAQVTTAKAAAPSLPSAAVSRQPDSSGGAPGASPASPDGGVVARSGVAADRSSATGGGMKGVSSDKPSMSPMSTEASDRGAATRSMPVKPQSPTSPSGSKPILSMGSTKAGGASPGAGTLASRRNFQGSLKVVTQKKKGENCSVIGHRRIQWCSKLSEKYELGSEVMPSCHKGMQVLFGKSRSNGIEVVIKVRSKRNSFKESEEKEWRASTEFMLNLPPSGNICKLYEVLEDVDAYYVVMEKCAGQDLFESLHSDSKMSIDESKAIMVQILNALADLHAEGLVHKDLKLENIMIDKTPSTGKSAARIWGGEVDSPKQNLSPVSVKIVDFDTVEEHTPMTPKRAKDVLGTDQYIAQEAYAGNYSPASDIFAVGVIAYRLLVGKFPFDARMFNDQPGENWVGSPKMKEIRDKLCKYKVNYDHKVFSREPQALSLVQSMLATRETDRPTAKEALAHPWFRNVREANMAGATHPPAELPHCVR